VQPEDRVQAVQDAAQVLEVVGYGPFLWQIVDSCRNTRARWEISMWARAIELIGSSPPLRRATTG
jgi:hypothetical protein